ncbi:MAG: cytochrome c oxidase subunit 3 [Chlamydiia bacterium]|nr:cytochrome c oxidase subunit 3 [Chlamydiia bacterium]
MSETYPDTHHDPYSNTTFGFWLFLITDFMLFATIFAAYAVLHKSTFGGPSAKELLNIYDAFWQTLVLLAAGFTSGMAGAFVHRKNKMWALIFFGLTFVLGAIFMWIEFVDFHELISAGHSWKTNAFLSAFFSLVGTHGVHILFALLWTIVLIIPVFKQGITPVSLKRLTCLRMFWQFCYIIWIFIFSIVYLMGGI